MTRAYTRRLYTIGDGMGRERIEIRAFASADARDRYLNRQHDNHTSAYVGPLTAGTYVYVGGEWVNLRRLAAETRAHV